MIEIKHLSKTFQMKDGAVNALSDINLTIPDGSIYGIIGMSGAGKSTLVRCINLLERPTEGSVVIDGVEMEKLSPAELRARRREITMIFQQFNLLAQRTVLGNICFPMEIAGTPREEAKARARELLKLVGLEDRENAYPAQLSGGQKQRISLARALAIRPSVLILDDTTSAVDMETEKQIQQSLRELDFPCTKIVIAQRISTTKTADKIIVLQNGYIEEMGTHEELMEKKGYYYELVKLQTGVDEL